MSYGARPLRRALERFIEDPLAEEVLRLGEGVERKIEVTVEGDIEKAEKLTFKMEEPAEEEPEPVGTASESRGAATGRLPRNDWARPSTGPAGPARFRGTLDRMARAGSRRPLPSAILGPGGPARNRPEEAAASSLEALGALAPTDS